MHSSLETYEKVPAFLYKLWKLVEDRSTDHLIRWQEDGKSFILYKQGQFSRELLPQYYKHNNMASFVRQLNMYGFRKVPSMEGGGLRLDRDEMEFAHPYFVRGQEHQLEFIKRKMTSGRVTSVGGGADESRMAELMSEVTALHRKHETLITQMNSLRRENAEVWTRYCDIDHKLQMQNNIIEKLTRFVVSVLKPKGINVNLTNVRRLPQLQALLGGGGHSLVPALTQGSNRSPLCDGPVIHEVVDDVFTNSDLDAAVTAPAQGVRTTNSLHLPHLPTSTGGIQPVLSPVTTTITEHGSGATVSQRRTVVTPTSSNNSRVVSLSRVPSDVHTVVGDGSGAVSQSEALQLPQQQQQRQQQQQQQRQQQQQQQLIVATGELQDVFITPDVEDLTTQGVFDSSNAVAAGNLVADFGVPVPTSSTSDLAVNCNPIVESPKGTLLSDGQAGLLKDDVAVQSGYEAASVVSAPMMVSSAGSSTNTSGVLPYTIFVGDNSHLTPSSIVQTVQDNFTLSDAKLRRGGTQTKTNTATASINQNGASGLNSRAPSTLRFTVGPNNTLIPTKNTHVVLSSSDPNVFTSIPIKQEDVMGQPLLTLAPSSTTTTTAPFLTRTGKQQHIVTNVSVIPNSNRVSINNMPSSVNTNMGTSSGKVQPVITNLDDRNSQNAILDSNMLSFKRSIQNNRVSGGKKTLFQVKNNGNAGSSSGNSFNNTISTMGNIVPSNSGIPSNSTTANNQSFNDNSVVKRLRGASTSTSSLDSGVTATGSGGAAMPVFKVVRKTTSQQQPSQQHSAPVEVDAAASELVAAAADLLLPSSSTDVVPLSNNSRDDMTKQMEDMQAMLDNLQDMFQSGQLERDQTALFSHIFNPDFPLSDFETMPGLDMSPSELTSSIGGDGSLQQQLALCNPQATQDLTALLDSPGRPYLGADDDQPFAMASLDPDLINTPNIQSRSPVRKKMRTAAPVKKEPPTEDDVALDPFLRNLYSGSNT